MNCYAIQGRIEGMTPKAGFNAFQRLPFHTVVGESVRRTTNVCIVFILKHLLRKRFFARSIRSFRLLLDLNDCGISRQLMIRADREPEHSFVLERELKPGMVVLDVGANLGFYAISSAKLVGPSGKVYAVEPHPLNYWLLQQNVLLNNLASIVETHKVAIASVSGKTDLFLSDKANWHTLCSHEFVRDPLWRRHYKDSLPVTAISLWDFTKERRAVDLVRMDLEGFEVAVLRGILPYIATNHFRAKILFETHPEFYHDAQNNMREVLSELLLTCGYHVKYIMSDGHKSNSGFSTFERKGYGEKNIVARFPICDRAVYEGVSNVDAIELICHSQAVHAALLEPLDNFGPST